MSLKRFHTTIVVLWFTVIIGSACTEVEGATSSNQDQYQPGSNRLTLPHVEPVQLENRPLRVIATTSIIGDIVGNVSGNEVDLLTLMDHGQDPHSFEPGAGELTAVARADVVFVNGWDLEEGLAEDLATIAGETQIVAVGANIDPLLQGDSHHDSSDAADSGHEHGRADPHTWFSVPNVKQWVENVTEILGDLDPANAAIYENNAQSYLLELEEVDNYLHKQISNIPEEKRILVTNHGVFDYFAQEYGFEVIGSVIPSTSTQAEPSAGDLAELINNMEQAGVCTIFTDITTNDDLAQIVAMELSDCAEVKIVPLHTGSLGLQGSDADSYTGMLRSNVDKIVEGLK